MYVVQKSIKLKYHKRYINGANIIFKKIGFVMTSNYVFQKYDRVRVTFKQSPGIHHKIITSFVIYTRSFVQNEFYLYNIIYRYKWYVVRRTCVIVYIRIICVISMGSKIKIVWIFIRFFSARNYTPIPTRATHTHTNNQTHTHTHTSTDVYI